MTITVTKELYAGTAAPSSGGGSGTGDSITATNRTGSAIAIGDKVFVEPSTENGNTVYKIMSFTPVQNFNTVGTPSFTYDFKVSGFSSSDYLTTSSPSIAGFNNVHSTWYFKFKTGGSISNGSILEGLIALQIYSGELVSWNGAISQSVTLLSSLSMLQDYWMKIVIDGSTRTFYYSTDGTNYTQCYTNNNFRDTTDDRIYITNIGYASWSAAFNGNVDLDKCYVEDSDGNVVWRAVDRLTPSCLTGIAKDAISVSSTGRIKTVLPEE